MDDKTGQKIPDRPLAFVRSFLKPAVLSIAFVVTLSGTLMLHNSTRHRLETAAERVVLAARERLEKLLGEISLLSRLSSVETSLQYGAIETLEKTLNQAVVNEEALVAIIITDSQNHFVAANSVSPEGLYIGQPPVLKELLQPQLRFMEQESDKFGWIETALVPSDGRQLLLLRKPIHYLDERVGHMLAVITLQDLFARVRAHDTIPEGIRWALYPADASSDCSTPSSFLAFTLCSHISETVVAKEALFPLLLFMGVVALLILASFLIVDRLLEKRLFVPLDAIFHVVEQTAQGESPQATSDLPHNLRNLKDRLSELVQSVKDAQHLKAAYALNSALAEMASQVAHDIRSPLTALCMLATETSDLPEERRTLLRNAVQRIHDIANTLLNKSQTNELTTGGPHLLFGLLDRIATEKRVQFRSRHELEIELPMRLDDYSLFIDINAIDFTRVLSNLIDNAAEAIHGPGKVTVRARGLLDQVEVIILDNGKGIPEHVLPTLGRKQISFGKEKGNGIGLLSARKIVEASRGTLEIHSQYGYGTSVTLRFLRATPPPWFLPRLQLRENQRIVTLDDDRVISNVWERRFDELGFHGERRHFSTPRQLETWLPGNRKTSDIFLIDYELIGSSENGIEIIERLDLCNQAFLVTSHFISERVIEGCKERSISLIPKNLVSILPMTLIHDDHSPVEAVLIDNDPLVRAAWKLFADNSSWRLRIYPSPAAFFDDIHHLDASIPIYIDQELDNGIKGADVAKSIFNSGFCNIILTTGSPSTPAIHPAWIRSVQGKTPMRG